MLFKHLHRRESPGGIGFVVIERQGKGRQVRACWEFEKEWDQMVNVKDLGAFGNNTDDTTAIQRALDSGQPVYIPAGDYLINTALVLKDGQHVFGDGYSSHLKFTATSNTNNIFQQSTTPFASIQIEKLRLEGNNASTAYNNGNGIYTASVRFGANFAGGHFPR
jgi:hypothetical protein